MSRLRVNAFGISIDGYGAGPDQALDNPMGVGGMALHQWVLYAMQKRHKTDVALIQNRDFYSGGLSDYLAEHAGHDTPLDVQEILDRIVWKGAKPYQPATSQSYPTHEGCVH